MSEQRASLGPRYAIRLGQLKPWHILMAKCWVCGHRRQLRIWQLKAVLPEHRRENAWLTDVEKRLFCQRCGNRYENQVLVLVKGS